MSSVERVPAQVPRNALYVNIAATSNANIFNADGSKVAWNASGPAASTLNTAGGVFRDMGKTVYLPAPTAPNAVAEQSTILRKVQWIPQNWGGFYGTGGAAGTVGSEFYTGYISLGGQTYAGGGAAGTCVFARAN